jgi:hypothetical protein
MSLIPDDNNNMLYSSSYNTEDIPTPTQYVTTQSPVEYTTTPSAVQYATTLPSGIYTDDNTLIINETKNVTTKQANIYNIGDIYVKPEKITKLSSQSGNNKTGQLGGVISETKSEIIFPECDNDNIYSYNGLLQCKGSDFTPLNTVTPTNIMNDRLSYQPPSLPTNLDFSYFGAIRNKGSDFKPLNTSIGINNEQILDGSYEKNKYKQEPPVPNTPDFLSLRPEINTTSTHVYNNNPVDVYSQFGALRSKNN